MGGAGMNEHKGFLVYPPLDTPESYVETWVGLCRVPLPKLLVHLNLMPSMREVRNFKGRWKLTLAPHTSNCDIVWVITDSRATYALAAGDRISSDDGTRTRLITWEDLSSYRSPIIPGLF